jgi:NAD-dependent SIR2 family protein deacetylase
MKTKKRDQLKRQPATAPDVKHDAGYFLYLKCMYCGTVYDTAPCADEMHGKFSRGICQNCATCGPFVPLTPTDEGCE